MPSTDILIREIRLLSSRLELLEKKISPPDHGYTCAEFGDLINRRARWVSERVSIGMIRSLTNKKPYCIPHSELERIQSRGGI